MNLHKVFLLTLCTIFIMLAFFISSCQNVADTHTIKKSTKPNAIQTPEEPSGTTYNDSMIYQLIENSLPKKSITIDTFKTLHSINIRKIKGINNYQFTIDSIFKYEDKLKKVTDELQIVLYVSHYFSSFSESAKFKSYIFFSQHNESHYSPFFELITIQNKSNNFLRIKLAGFYGNELQDKSISTLFINDSNFIRSIKQDFRYIHGIGNVDSSSLTKEYYHISDKGNFVLDSVQVW